MFAPLLHFDYNDFLTGGSGGAEMNQMRIGCEKLVEFPFGRRVGAKVQSPCWSNADQISSESFEQATDPLLFDYVPAI